MIQTIIKRWLPAWAADESHVSAGLYRRLQLATQVSLTAFGITLPFIVISLVIMPQVIQPIVAETLTALLALLLLRGGYFVSGRLVVACLLALCIVFLQAMSMNAGEDEILGQTLLIYAGFPLSWLLFDVRRERGWMLFALTFNLLNLIGGRLLNPVFEFAQPLDNHILRSGWVGWLCVVGALLVTGQYLWFQSDSVQRAEDKVTDLLQDLRRQNQDLILQKEIMDERGRDLQQNLLALEEAKAETEAAHLQLEAQNAHLMQVQEELLTSQRYMKAVRAREASLARLNEQLRWEPGDTIASWGNRLLAALADEQRWVQACLYVVHRLDTQVLLRPAATFAGKASDMSISLGEGLVGQAAETHDSIYIPLDITTQHTDARDNLVVTGTAQVQGRMQVLLPLVHQGQLQGVLEAQLLQPADDDGEAFLNRLSVLLAGSLASISVQQHSLAKSNVVYQQVN